MREVKCSNKKKPSPVHRKGVEAQADVQGGMGHTGRCRETFQYNQVEGRRLLT